MTPMWIVIIVVVAVVAWTIVTYNGFVKLTQRTKEAWADFSVKLSMLHIEVVGGTTYSHQ